MRKRLPVFLFLVACGSLLVGVQAQLSTNPYKFLGNITTTYNMDTDGFIFSDLWNQVTPENETKWSSIEGNRGSFNWGGRSIGEVPTMHTIMPSGKAFRSNSTL